VNQVLVLRSTDHTSYDYGWIVKNAKLVVDTRNAVKKSRKNVVKAWVAMGRLRGQVLTFNFLPEKVKC